MAHYTDNIIRKVNYYNDMLLTEDELNVEQYYHVKMRGMQNAAFFGYGILEGLEVEFADKENEPFKIRIKKGKALVLIEDENKTVMGKEVIILKDVELDLKDKISSTTSVFLTLYPIESYEDVNPLKGNGFQHRVERCAVELFTLKDSIKVDKIYLAELKIKLEGNNIIGIDDIIQTDRRFGGLDTGRVLLNRVEFDFDHKNDESFVKPLASIMAEVTGTGNAQKNSLFFNSIDVKIKGTGLEDEATYNINGDANITGDLTVGKNFIVGGDNSQNTIIEAKDVFFQDEIITLNNNTSSNPKNNSGIEVYTEANQPRPFIQFVEKNDKKLWIVSNDGTVDINSSDLNKYKLAINIPSTITDKSNADAYHHHSFLNSTKAIAALESGKIIIGHDINNLPSDVQNLSVNGMIYLDKDVIFSNGMKQGALKSLFYTHVFVPSGSNSSDDTNKLKNLIADNRIIFIADNSTNTMYIKEAINISGNKNLKIIAAESLVFKTDHTGDCKMMFSITGNCSNIGFSNIKIEGKLGLCVINAGTVTEPTKIDGLTIRGCCKEQWDISDLKSENYKNGFLLNSSSTPSTDLLLMLSNLLIENNKWYSMTGEIIKMYNSKAVDLIIRNNRFNDEGTRVDSISINISSRFECGNIDISDNVFQSYIRLLLIESNLTANRINGVKFVKNSIKIINNSTLSSVYAVTVKQIDNAAISGNSVCINNFNSAVAVEFDNSKYFRVSDNIIKINPSTGGTGNAVRALSNCSNYIVINNLVRGSISVAGGSYISDKNLILL